MKGLGKERLNLDGLSVLGCFLLVSYILIAVAWCRRYDARQLLWFCDVAVLMTALGLLFRSPLLVMAQLAAVVFYHSVWNIDFWLILILGYAPVGSTSYMFYSDLGLLEKSLSLFTHVFIVPVALFGVYNLGAPNRAWLLQWVQTSIIFLLTYLFTIPEENINRMFGVEIIGVSPASINPILYYALMVTVPPFVVYLPTNRLMAMIISRCRLKSKPVMPNKQGLFSSGHQSLSLHPLSALALMLFAAAFSVVVSYHAGNKHSFDLSIFHIVNDDRSLLEEMPSSSISTSVEQILFGNREELRQARLLVWPHATLPKQWSGSDGKLHPHTKSTLLEVKVDDIPSVPQEVWLRGTRSVSGSTVWACVVSDDFYLQIYCDLNGAKRSFELHCKIGGRGISEYVDPLTGEMYVSTAYNEIIGEGTGAIYALGVIESLEGRVVARSPFYLVKRRGIFSPEDVWFTIKDSTLIPLISNPGEPVHSRVAFQSPNGQANERTDIYTCDYFGYKKRNLNQKSDQSCQLFTGEGKPIDGTGWARNKILRYYTEKDGESVLVQTDDSR